MSIPAPSSAEVASYIEEMLAELAQMAASAGHRSLAHTICVATLEAARVAGRH